jgi:hypothetical protein
VGDALTRTITLRATDASSMMLPITEFPTVDGLAIYPNPTRASDTGGERGEARNATRIDGATYVLETEGSYTLPPIERSWWDVSAARLREASVPEVSFTVAPNPELAGEIALPDDRESEAAYFDRVLAACGRHDAAGTMQALLAWVDRVTPSGQSPTLGRLLEIARDEELSGAVRGLEGALYGQDDSSGWLGDSLARSLERVRRAQHVLRLEAKPGLLAPLNPRTSVR